MRVQVADDIASAVEIRHGRKRPSAFGPIDACGHRACAAGHGDVLNAGHGHDLLGCERATGPRQIAGAALFGCAVCGGFPVGSDQLLQDAGQMWIESHG
ncbi:hypothetical protein SDC9_175138 [bioreactor metagenome]|uniref:Uncharacterized protein n=1 Tax=bioreactor metagenome TaxID=1076179 RepID=A0A645GUJ9_9ZZZZ